MLDELDAESLVAEVVLTFDAGLPVVVVEGDLDEAFISEFALPGVAVVNARGKPRIVDVIEAILLLDIPLLVLMDGDFDRQLGTAIEHPDVIYTDRYNLEASLLLEEQVFSGIWELNMRPKSRATVSPHAAYDFCVSNAIKVGKVRLASARNLLGLDTSRFPMEHAINETSLHGECELDVVKVVDITVCRSNNSSWVKRRRRAKEEGYVIRARKTILAHVRKLELVGDSDELCLISGHDVSRLANLLMARLKKTVPSAGEIEWQSLHEAKKLDSIPLLQSLRHRASSKGMWPVQS